MEKFIRDVATVPNAITVSRMALTGTVLRGLEDDPRANWPKAAAVGVSDNIDGAMARAGRTFSLLQKFGLRESTFGQLLDPVADKIYGYRAALVGIRTGIIPQTIGQMSMNAKSAMAVQAMVMHAQGRPFVVSQQGKRSEFFGNIGLGSFFAAESIDNPQIKQVARLGASLLTLYGTTGTMQARQQYARSSN